MDGKLSAYMHGEPLALQELRPSELKALKALAEHGSLTAYRLYKIAEISIRASYPALQGLAEKTYAEHNEAGKCRAGTIKKEYSLTRWGFCNALTILEEKADILKCVKKWSHLDSLVLNNIDSLKYSFGEHEVIEALKYAASQIAASVWLNSNDKRIGDSPLMRELFREAFFTRLINPAKYYRVEKHVLEWNLPSPVKEWWVQHLKKEIEWLNARLDWATRFLNSIKE